MQLTKNINLASSTVLTVIIWGYYILTMVFPSRDESLSASRIYPQVAMAITCIYCLVVSFVYRRYILEEPLLKWFMLLLLMAFVYVFVNGVDSIYDNFLTFLKQNMSIMFLFAWYIEMFKDEEAAKRNVMLIFFMQLIYVFYNLWLDLSAGHGFDQRAKIFDSNSGFLFECCIPMAVIFPIKRIRIYLYITLFTGCLASGQRSAALAALACMPLALVYLKKGIKKTDIVILAALLTIAIIPILDSAIDNLIKRQQLELQGRSIGSGRSIFWALVWEHFWKGDILHILLGNGYGSVQKLLKETYGMAILSHNGWLDYMYIFGLLGLSLYIRTLFSFYEENRAISRSGDEEYKNIFLIILILFIVKCTTSHGYWDISCMPLAMTMAIALHGHYKVLQENSLTQDEYD